MSDERQTGRIIPRRDLFRGGLGLAALVKLPLLEGCTQKAPAIPTHADPRAAQATRVASSGDKIRAEVERIGTQLSSFEDPLAQQVGKLYTGELTVSAIRPIFPSLPVDSFDGSTVAESGGINSLAYTRFIKLGTGEVISSSPYLEVKPHGEVRGAQFPLFEKLTPAILFDPRFLSAPPSIQELLVLKEGAHFPLYPKWATSYARHLSGFGAIVPLRPMTREQQEDSLWLGTSSNSSALVRRYDFAALLAIWPHIEKTISFANDAEGDYLSEGKLRFSPLRDTFRDNMGKLSAGAAVPSYDSPEFFDMAYKDNSPWVKSIKTVYPELVR